MRALLAGAPSVIWIASAWVFAKPLVSTATKAADRAA